MQRCEVSIIIESLVPIFVVIFLVTIVLAAQFMPTSLQLSLLIDYLYFIVGDISLRLFYDIIILFFFYFGHLEDSFVQCLEIFLLGLFGLFLELKQFHPLIGYFVGLEFEFPGILLVFVFEFECYDISVS